MTSAPLLRAPASSFPARIVAPVLAALMGLASPALGSDWPAYKKDANRSGITDEKLEFPLRAVWVYEPSQAPRPAWPEPGREMHRIDFDYAYQPVAAGGLVYFGSSADDTIRAIDAATGRPRWQFTTGGPVRLAPHVADGRCYAASDDGFAYCLDAATGKLLWKFRAAPSARKLIGNGRMISRWPCRSGILVCDDVVYVTAGMWPSDGVYVYALDAATGKVIWCNDTSGAMFMLYPHGGATAIGGVAPQGYLLASRDVLLVPTGRSVPAGFDRRTGRLLYYRPGEYRKSGGAWATVSGDFFFNPDNGGGQDRSAVVGESPSLPGDGMRMYSCATGESLETFAKRYRVLADRNVLYAAGQGVLQALTFGKVRGTAKHPRVYSIARAADAILLGGPGTITAFSAANCYQVWQGRVDSQARGIAVADGRLIVATSTGKIYCFARADEAVGPVVVKPERRGAADRARPPSSAARAIDAIRRANVTRGYALVIGQVDARLGEALAVQTGLHVICVIEDEKKVASERSRLLAGGLYGRRVVVDYAGDLARLPYPQYFANAVVVAGGAGRVAPGELYRVLRPCGGVMCFVGEARGEAAKLIAQAAIAPAEVRTHGDSLTVVRGKLDGAFDWDSRAASDQRVRWPLELLWFGGPGPARMINRHWGAPTPIPANGRYFVIAEDHLIAVDAYNGLELWSRKLPDLAWTVGGVRGDDDTVYVDFGDLCLALDAQSGKVRKLYGEVDRPKGVSRDQLKAFDLKAPRGELKDLPAHARGGARVPIPISQGQRYHPLTSELVERKYRRAYGCGGIISSATMDFFRSGTFGFYDLYDDSGVRNFAGARPGCGLTMIPALGILIANEGSAGCSCSYSFQTSLAMAPAATPSNEDWAVFYDDAPYGVTRHAALNFAAPGDRRDDRHVLWLTMPRPQTPTTLVVPAAIEVEQGFGAYRFNADRTPVAGTDSPWIYGSGLRGLKRAILDLEGFWSTSSVAVGRAPAVDGRLDEPCWDGKLPLTCEQEGATVLLRHDARNLYVGYTRPAIVDRRGKAQPWRQSTGGDDAPVWKDDSFEIHLSDGKAMKSVHLGVAASGAKYDGLWTHVDPGPVFDIPRLEGIAIDGKIGDWGDKGFRVRSLVSNKRKMRLPENFDPTFRLGWNDKGLLLLVEVRDDKVVEYQSRAGMWAKDSIELFMALRPGSRQRFHAVVSTGADPKHPATRTFFLDRRQTKIGNLTMDASGCKTAQGYLIEALLPWRNLGIEPAVGVETAFQILINDADTTGPFPGNWFRVAWHPDGHAGFRAKAYRRVRLALKPSPPFRLNRGKEVDRKGLVWAAPAETYPVLKIPRLEGITVDGLAGDWGGRGFRQLSLAGGDGRMRAPEDFDPSLRLGWCDRGLLLLAKVRDDVIAVNEAARDLWRKDSVEIIMAPHRGSSMSFQLTIAPGRPGGPKALTSFIDRRSNRSLGKLSAETAVKRTDDGYVVEAMLPWRNLGIKAADGGEIGLQVFINDADETGYPGEWFRAAWCPVGHPQTNPMAYHRVGLSAAGPGKTVAFRRGRSADDDGFFRAAEPYPWPLPEARVRKSREDKSWNGAWTAARQADKKAFTVEMAIPFKTLASAGLDTDGLIVNVARRGKLLARPGGGFSRLELRDSPASPPRPYTVRLHFAEMLGAEAGRRVFDVKLQDKVVLKDFDVVAQAGGPRRALVKEFKGVMASTKLRLELAPKAPRLTEDTAPIISGMEVVAE